MIENCASEASIASTVAKRIAEMAANSRTPIRVALTGGTLGIAVLAQLGNQNIVSGQLRLVFGDERFVSLTDPDRNEAQGLAVWPGLSASDWLRFPEPGELDLESARGEFEATFREWLGDDSFDLVILGMGPDGHVASLFPNRDRPGKLVIAEPDSPKPPAQRLSLSYEVLGNSERVWFLVAGAQKAAAAACSYLQSCELPAAKVRGRETIWFVDDAVAQAISAKN
jgi:6-phosphogluconolactonase